MIKVYVYVVGLALLDPTADGVNVYFPDGKKHPDRIEHGAVPNHETEATWNGKRPPVDVPADSAERRMATALKTKMKEGLTLTSSASPSSATNEPGTELSLQLLLMKEKPKKHPAHKVKDDCATECGLSAMMTLVGPWNRATVDFCGTDDADEDAVLPRRDLKTAPALNFLNALRSWNRRYEKAEELPRATNAIEFSGLVPRIVLAAALGVEPQQLDGALVGSSVCSAATGEPSDYQCAFLALRNGALAASSPYRTLLGAADPHFGSYYSLLQEEPKDLWLPVAVGVELCGSASGGGNPGGGCSPLWTELP